MARSTKTRVTNSKVASTEPVETLEVDIDSFTAEDYEILADWSSDNEGGYTIKQAFDILDRVIVGGFRHRRFVDIKGVIQTMMKQLTDYANSKN
jgi:hypothetical protein